MKFYSSALLFAALFTSAVAQTTILPAPDQAANNPMEFSSPIDTTKFFPQIDRTLTSKPGRPSNPMQIPLLTSAMNDLKFGEMTSTPRTAIERLFPGIGATGWVPADPDIAVGPNHIVSVVNSSIGFFTKTGTSQFQQQASAFFTGLGAGTFIFDPKCFYDKANGRYVLVILEQSDTTQTSKLLFAVSDDNDPNGTWYRYRLEARLTVGGVNYWLDYPGLGGNQNAYVVTGNMFGFTSGFAGARFIVIPKTPVLTGAAVSTFSLRDSSGASVQVAEAQDSTATGIYAISRSGTSNMKVYCVNNPSTAPTLSSAFVAVPTFTVPSGAATSTSNRTLDALDGRVMNAAWRGGKLVTSHCVLNGSFKSCRWYELNTGSWPASGLPTLTQSGQLGSTTANFICPAVAINSVGSIGAIFTRCNTSITADVAVTGRVASDAAGTMGAPQILATSAGNNYASARWGDYFGCDVDPLDDTKFWGVAMTVASTNNWATQIVSWNVVAAPVVNLSSVSINPSTVRGGVSSTGTVTLSGPAPAGGATVILSSNNTSFARVSGQVVVPQGATSATFVINTSRTTTNRVVTITASRNGVTRTANITVTR